MITTNVPGRAALQLEHPVLAVNGTLALDGVLLPGVVERLATLRPSLTLHLLTADTHGRQREVDRQLDLTGLRLAPGTPEDEQKAAYVRTLGAQSVVAIGNGQNDALMLRGAVLGIIVLGDEGTAVRRCSKRTSSRPRSSSRSTCYCTPHVSARPSAAEPVAAAEGSGAPGHCTTSVPFMSAGCASQRKG